MRASGRWVGVAIAAALAALAGTAAPGPPQKKAAVAPAAARTPTPAPSSPASWKEVDRLVSEQKFEEASGAGRRAPAVGEGPPRLRRLDEGADPFGPAPHGAPRLRDRRAIPQGRALAAGPSLAHDTRALLRPVARELRADVLVGGLAARARRVDGEGGPQGLDARADLRRGGPRLRRPLEGPRGAGRRKGQGARGVRRAKRLPAGDPRHPARRRRLFLRRHCSPTLPVGARLSRTRSSPSTCRGFSAPTPRRRRR